MRYVLLKEYGYDGCYYEKSFASIQEAEIYVCKSDHEYWELWNTDTNEEVEFNQQYDNHVMAHRTWTYLGEVRDV